MRRGSSHGFPPPSLPARRRTAPLPPGAASPRRLPILIGSPLSLVGPADPLRRPSPCLREFAARTKPSTTTRSSACIRRRPNTSRRRGSTIGSASRRNSSHASRTGRCAPIRCPSSVADGTRPASIRAASRASKTCGVCPPIPSMTSARASKPTLLSATTRGSCPRTHGASRCASTCRAERPGLRARPCIPPGIARPARSSPPARSTSRASDRATRS